MESVIRSQKWEKRRVGFRGSGKCSWGSQAQRGNRAEVGLYFLMSLNSGIIKVGKELQMTEPNLWPQVGSFWFHWMDQCGNTPMRHEGEGISITYGPLLFYSMHKNPEKHQMRFVQLQKGKCEERVQFPWQKLKTWAKENPFSLNVGDDTWVWERLVPVPVPSYFSFYSE